MNIITAVYATALTCTTNYYCYYYRHTWSWKAAAVDSQSDDDPAAAAATAAATDAGSLCCVCCVVAVAVARGRVSSWPWAVVVRTVVPLVRYVVIYYYVRGAPLARMPAAARFDRAPWGTTGAFVLNAASCPSFGGGGRTLIRPARVRVHRRARTTPGPSSSAVTFCARKDWFFVRLRRHGHTRLLYRRGVRLRV